MAADFIMSAIPSSRIRTAKVAIQGKYMVRTTLATTNWERSKPSGSSMPTATSLRRKPMIKAPTASRGKPKTPVTMGAVSRPINWIIPNE